MLDAARTIVLLVALVQAVRHRFGPGIVFGGVMAAGFGAVAVAAHQALVQHAISGDYGIVFVYVGPTMLPFGRREWLPTAVQAAFTLLAGIPMAASLRTPSSPVATPFVAVFVPNAMMAVLTALGALLLWRQEASLPEYWESAAPCCRDLDEVGRLSGKRIMLTGTYSPVREVAGHPLAIDGGRALEPGTVVIQGDGAPFIMLGAYRSARRSTEEINRLAGKQVQVVGTLHRDGPCVDEIELIDEVAP